MVHKIKHLYLRNCQLAFIYVLCYMEEISIKTTAELRYVEVVGTHKNTST